MSKKMIIGLAGKARAGKDTVALLLEEMFDFRTYAFATAIKDVSAILFNVPMNCFYDDDLKEVIIDRWGLSSRQMAQKVGTEIGHQFGKDIWIRRLADDLHPFDDKIVISDVRFDTEAEWIREQGGVIINVERKALGDGVVSDHVSENGITLLDSDYVVHNDGTMKDLRDVVEVVMGEIDNTVK